MPLLDEMGFSASSLLAGLIFGIIGMWLFGRGRKTSNLHFVVIGLILMVYPYFTKGLVADWGIGTALCGMAYYFRFQ